MEATKCPSCGKPKKAGFKLCYKCNLKEKTKPTCEVCGVEVPQGYFLCKTHWKERQEEKKDTNKLNYVKEQNSEKIEEQVDKIEQKSSQQTSQETINKTTTSTIGGFFKKAFVATGKGIVKGATTITDTAQKAIQIRRWKDKILIRLDSNLIKQLARENRIHPELVDKPTNDDYINAIKNEVH